MDFRLVFRRVADVVFCPGDEVPVGLWHVTRSCVESLDRYEGFPRVYQRRFVLVHTHAGPVWSFVYVMTGRELEPPKQEYFDTIRAGYTHFDLPHPVLHAARRASFPRPTAVNSKRGNT